MLRTKRVNGCSAESHVSHMLSDRLISRPKGWSHEGADRMSKLRCYEKNYGRDKIIDLVKYSREVRKGLRTGTDDMPVKALTLREVTAEHYDQAKELYRKNTSNNTRSYSQKISCNKNTVKIIIKKETIVCDDAIELRRWRVSAIPNRA